MRRTRTTTTTDEDYGGRRRHELRRTPCQEEGLHAKLSDFGHARLLSELRPAKNAALIGAPGYIAPEAWMGRGWQGKVDVWSAGIVAFELFVGQRRGCRGPASSNPSCVVSRSCPLGVGVACRAVNPLGLFVPPLWQCGSRSSAHRLLAPPCVTEAGLGSDLVGARVRARRLAAGVGKGRQHCPGPVFLWGIRCRAGVARLARLTAFSSWSGLGNPLRAGAWARGRPALSWKLPALHEVRPFGRVRPDLCGFCQIGAGSANFGVRRRRPRFDQVSRETTKPAPDSTSCVGHARHRSWGLASAGRGPGSTRNGPGSTEFGLCLSA